MKKMMLVLSAVSTFAAVAAFAGELPAGYTPLNYICSTGAQYLNTGYTPASTDKIEMKLHLFGFYAGQCAFCARGTSATDKSFSAFFTNTGTLSGYDNNPVRMCFGFAYNNATSYVGNPESHKDHTIVADGNAASWAVNGENLLTKASASFTAGGPLVLAASYTMKSGAVQGFGSYATCRIYFCKVTDKDGNVKVDLVPCKNDSGVLGLYDLQRDQFYPSDSGTAFVEEITSEDWYLTGNQTVNNIFTTPTCWKNAAGDSPTGAIGNADICHMENGYTWKFSGGDRGVGVLHLGAVDGATAATISCNDNARVVAGVLYWHSGTLKTVSRTNRRGGLKGGHAYLDCANKTHAVSLEADGSSVYLSPDFHCDEPDLVLSLSSSTTGGHYDLSGDNGDYRGSISLSGGSGAPLVAGHANALGDPSVSRADALTVDKASSILTARKSVKLNAARGIRVNQSGFEIKAGTISGSSGNGAFSFDCTSFEVEAPICGSYGFAKTGTGTVTYTGDYTAGEIVVKAGRLIIGADASFPAGQAITVTNATLEVHQPLSNFTITELAGATVIESMDTIEVPFDTTTTNVTTVVRKRLTLSPGVKQPIRLSAGYLVPCHEALEFEVLRIAPGSADFTSDDFDDQTTKTSGLPRTTLTVTKDADGTQHVVITTRPVVKSVSGCVNLNGAASSWSDNQLPHRDADYLLVHRVSDLNNAVFGGDSLTIANNAELGIASTSQHRLQTASGEPVIIYPGVFTKQSWQTRDHAVVGSIFLVGSYGDSGVFNFYTKYADAGSSKLRLEATVSGAGTLQVSGPSNGAAWNGLYGNNTNFFGKIIFTGETTTDERRGTQVRVKDWRSFGGRLDEFHADALTIGQYAAVRAIADVTLTNDVNRGIRIGNGCFNCDAGKTFKTTWPIQLNGTMYKHGTGTLILGGAMTHDTSSTGSFFVRAGTIGILSDAAAEGLTVKSTNDFAIALTPESTAVNGFTGLELTPPPGSEVLPKVTVKVDSAKFAKGVGYKLPICTVANDSGVTADTFVFEQVPHYRCSLVAEPVDATTTRYSLKCSKPGLIIVVE